MKFNSCKSSPRKKIYRSCKDFDIDLFKIAFQEKLIHLENDTYSALSSAFRVLLNEHAPLKTKTRR